MGYKTFFEDKVQGRRKVWKSGGVAFSASLHATALKFSGDKDLEAWASSLTLKKTKAQAQVQIQSCVLWLK